MDIDQRWVELQHDVIVGNGAVGLTGNAGSAGVLQISSESNELGSVAVGGTASKSFTVTNTGGSTGGRPPQVGRNVYFGHGMEDIDFRISRDFALTEKYHMQFLGEAFNLFNRTNFNLPDNFVGSPTFGQILSAQSPRRLQLGAKLMF